MTSKKDYEKAAKMIKSAFSSKKEKQVLIKYFSLFFADEPNFNPVRFEKACYPEGEV